MNQQLLCRRYFPKSRKKNCKTFSKHIKNQLVAICDQLVFFISRIFIFHKTVYARPALPYGLLAAALHNLPPLPAQPTHLR